MRKNYLIVAFVSLVASLATQAAATASESHHARATDHAILSERVRNSNADAIPDDIGLQSGRRDYDEGAMTSGIAGH
jgi:hypothetical protein